MITHDQVGETATVECQLSDSPFSVKHQGPKLKIKEPGVTAVG